MNLKVIRILSATAAGIGVGVVAAVAIPTASSRTTEAPFLAPTEPLKVGTSPPPQASATPGALQAGSNLNAGSVRIELRRPDPAGGPDWAVRTFTVRQGNTAAMKKLGVVPVNGGGGFEVCAQLGRILHGTFGWIDGTNTFRPVVAGDNGTSTTSCDEGDPAATHIPIVQNTTLLDRPDTRNPVVRGAVVWGLVGGAVTGAQLHTGGRSLVPARSKRDGAFLEFFGPDRPTADASVVVRYADGQRVDTGSQAYSAGAMIRSGLAQPADRSTSTVIARAPDPAGGPSWALTGYRTIGGLWCTGQPGYLIDGRVGDIDATLGILSEPPPGRSMSACGPTTQPTVKQPLMLASSSGAVGPILNASIVGPDRSALRLQPGRTIVWGKAMSGVATITIVTDRDIRTLVPNAPSGGFLVVYDGLAGLGATVFTVRLGSGRVVKEKMTLNTPG